MEPVIIRMEFNQPCITSSPYTLLIRRLEPSLLILLNLDIPFSYHSAALMSEATRVSALLGTVTLCYNIFL